MESFLKVIGGSVVASLTVFCFMLLYPLLGALSGLIVGYFFGSWMLPVLSQIGIHVPLWQLGATLSWIGGFFRFSQTQQGKD